MFRALLFGLLLMGMAVPASAQVIHERFQPPVTARKIQLAIDDAILYLQNSQQEDGSIPGAGQTELAALAMLAAGHHPQTDLNLQKALTWLATQEPNNTYQRGVMANVWEYALRRMPDNKEYQKLLKREYDWLIAALGNKSGWRYTLQSTDWDNSCTQYGVLGIWAATRAGLDPGDEFWKKLSEHFLSCQNPDGGWGYVNSGSTPNMATAGLASLFLVFDKYHGKSFYSKNNPRTFTEGNAAKVLDALDKGMAWLGQAQGNKTDGYYLYGIERTGVASGLKYIGGEDWFAQGAESVLLAQRPDGSIPLGHWGGPAGGTAFCVMFLVYGGAPVAFNKLEYGDEHDWNLNPRDLANLTKELWGAYERPLNWQTVSITAPASEFEAPILFISGSKAAKFSEEEMLKLREYILRGGTILAEPSDHSKAFTESMKELLAQMFDPRDYPEYQFQPLPDDHPIYTVIRQKWTKKPKLLGVSDGTRTFFLLSEEYLSAEWQMNNVEHDAFKLATSLLFYATDLSTLEGKFATLLPDEPPTANKEKAMQVARVKFQGVKTAPLDWAVAPHAWNRANPYITHVTGYSIQEAPSVILGKSDLKEIQLLHISGQHTLQLSEQEKEALKQFVEQGGTVLVDAYAGSEEFATSARRELESIFGKLKPLPAQHVLSQGLFQGGEDLTKDIRFKLPARQLLRKQGKDTRSQQLEAVMIDERPAVLFSPFDLTASLSQIEIYQSVGYKPVSSLKIVANLTAYLMAD